MKIFYGVQGTGNGHITRARNMAQELAAAGIEVDFLFTGRKAEDYFDMQVFNAYQTRQGLTFAVQKGDVNYLNTARQSNFKQFFADKAALDLSAYDLVISDFEPLTSWAAKAQDKTVLGIGHQYAFDYAIPKQGYNPMAASILKHFAPVTVGIGLHWQHFGQPILPPVIDTTDINTTLQDNKIIVYLPFETLDDIIKLLLPFSAYEFHVYTTDVAVSPAAHIQLKPISRTAFQHDWASARGVISNAGFELASESLRTGKKILAKPLHKQMEQISNAYALKHLGFGTTMFDLDQQVVAHWLQENRALQVTYPNVAARIVEWIKQGMPKLEHDFIASVWDEVDVLRVKW